MIITTKQTVTLLMLAALTACGGGGGGGGDTAAQSVTASGRVTESVKSTGVDKALVDIKLKTTNPFVNSGADGAYSLSLLKNELPTNFVGTVAKAGYLPGTVFFKYVGGLLEPSSAGSNNVALVLRDEGADVKFPVGLTIVHVGDGTFEGTANSQFQVKESGLIWNDSFTPTALQILTYTKLTVTLFARGVETTGLTPYCNKIVLGDNFSGGNIIGGDRQPLTATASDGSFSQITHTFTLPPVSSGASVYLQILSGKKCDNPASDNDDFEVVSVVGKLTN